MVSGGSAGFGPFRGCGGCGRLVSALLGYGMARSPVATAGRRVRFDDGGGSLGGVGQSISLQEAFPFLWSLGGSCWVPGISFRRRWSSLLSRGIPPSSFMQRSAQSSRVPTARDSPRPGTPRSAPHFPDSCAPCVYVVILDVCIIRSTRCPRGQTMLAGMSDHRCAHTRMCVMSLFDTGNACDHLAGPRTRAAKRRVPTAP